MFHTKIIYIQFYILDFQAHYAFRLDQSLGLEISFTYLLVDKYFLWHSSSLMTKSRQILILCSMRAIPLKWKLSREHFAFNAIHLFLISPMDEKQIAFSLLRWLTVMGASWCEDSWKESLVEKGKGFSFNIKCHLATSHSIHHNELFFTVSLALNRSQQWATRVLLFPDDF